MILRVGPPSGGSFFVPGTVGSRVVRLVSRIIRTPDPHPLTTHSEASNVLPMDTTHTHWIAAFNQEGAQGQEVTGQDIPEECLTWLMSLPEEQQQPVYFLRETDTDNTGTGAVMALSRWVLDGAHIFDGARVIGMLHYQAS